MPLALALGAFLGGLLDVIKPALVWFDVLGEDAGLVLGGFGLVVFEEHVITKAAEDFDFASDVAHAVAEAFGGAVEQGFGVVDDLCAAHKGDLELGLHAGDGTALEDVVGADAASGELAHEAG